MHNTNSILHKDKFQLKCIRSRIIIRFLKVFDSTHHQVEVIKTKIRYCAITAVIIIPRIVYGVKLAFLTVSSALGLTPTGTGITSGTLAVVATSFVVQGTTDQDLFQSRCVGACLNSLGVCPIGSWAI